MPITSRLRATAGILLAALSAVAVAQTNTTFVVKNSTGVPDNQVFVKFLAAKATDGIVMTSVPQTYGTGTTIAYGTATSATSYSLAQLKGIVNGGVTNFKNHRVPTFSLNSYGASGNGAGRIYFSLYNTLCSQNGGGPSFLAGQVDNTGTCGAQASPDINTTYGFVEGQVHGSGLNSNIDVTYVDFAGLPISASPRTSSGTALVIPNGTPAVSNRTLIAALSKAVPAAATIPATTPTASPTKAPTGPNVARVLSSVHSGAYHDFSALISSLRSGKLAIPVASYVPPTTSPLSGKQFWYVGQSGNSGTTPTLPSSFMNPALYSFTATFVADLNPNGTANPVAALQGVAGAHLIGFLSQPSGSALSVPSGTVSIYVTDASLNSPSGLYGNNPNYWVVYNNTAYYANNGISYDVTGRIVGSFCAGFTFGWVNNQTSLTSQATATGFVLPADFTEATVGAIPVEKYLALLSLQTTTKGIGNWIGAGISTNANTYDVYANAGIAAGSNPYFTGFQDRLQGNQEPIFFWPVGTAPKGYQPIGQGYILIELLPPARMPRPKKGR